MVRVTTSYTFSAATDGHPSNQRFTIDIASMLSEKYGKLIRQGQVFMVTGIDVRAFNPNTLVQDSVSAASGNLYYFHPTANRKRAWKSAFNAVQTLRRQVGLNEKGYDFRVGYHPTYGGIMQQAWVRTEDDVLTLGGPSDDRNCIFAVHNAQLVDNGAHTEPVDASMNGFGTPFDTSNSDLDFKEDGYGTVTHDTEFFTEGTASLTVDAIPWVASATGLIDFDLINEDEYFGPSWTMTALDQTCPVMCGVLGVHIDSTVTDDLLTQDVGIQVTLDVTEWKPIINKKKGRKSRGKSKRRRK